MLKRIWGWVKWNLLGGRARTLRAWKRMLVPSPGVAQPTNPDLTGELTPTDIGNPAGVPSAAETKAYRDRQHDKMLNAWFDAGEGPR